MQEQQWRELPVQLVLLLKCGNVLENAAEVTPEPGFGENIVESVDAESQR